MGWLGFLDDLTFNVFDLESSTDPANTGPSVEELAIQEKQAEALDLENELLGLRIESLKESQALFEKFAPTEEDALRLKELSALELDLKEQELKLTGAIQTMLAEQFAAGPTELEKRLESIALLQSERLEKALRGELPISEGSKQRRIDAEKVLDETLSRKGIKPGGTAYAESKALFNRNFDIQEDLERRGEISAGTAGFLSTIGKVFGKEQQEFANLGAFSKPGGLGGLYGAQTELITSAAGITSGLGREAGNLATGFLQSLQPFQFQRDLEFRESLKPTFGDRFIESFATGLGKGSSGFIFG